MSTIDHIDTSAPPRDLRLAGIAGWAATVMVFTGVIISSSTGAPEPNFDAPADKIQRYLETQDPWAVAVGGFLLAFGLVAWLWFVCGLAAAVRRPGPRPDFLSTVVLVSGTAAVAVMLNGAPQASEARGSAPETTHSIKPETERLTGLDTFRTGIGRRPAVSCHDLRWSM